MDLLIQIASLAFGFGVLERLPRLRFQAAAFFRRGFGSDALHLLTSMTLASLTLGFVALGSGLLGWLGLPRLSALGLPGLASAGLALVLLDLGHYAVHLSLHRFDALWALHKVHHSSLALDWLATFRSHLQQALRHFATPLLLVLVGPPLGAVALALTVHGVFALLNHSNLAPPLRWLEPVFVTPRLHRVHHGVHTSEMNLGVVFTLWDRLRGTLVTHGLAPAASLGVPGELDSYPQTWARQQLEPLRAVRARGAAAAERAAA
jgi:sterol desaturase/sphingolipid hydroxylase (fatty acid hydroxylase superfamily)